MCAGVDQYSSWERHVFCSKNLTNDDASAVFDFALIVVIIFHMVEWLRQTVFLTVSLVNVNLIPLYYFLSLIVPFGFIAMFIGLYVGWTSDEDC